MVSPVDSILFGAGAECIGAGHAVQLTLQPSQVVVGGYAQNVTSNRLTESQRNTVRHLMAQNIPITNLIHINGAELGKKGVSLIGINCIIWPNGRTYRVKHFVDDPATSPDVDFYCQIA